MTPENDSTPATAGTNETAADLLTGIFFDVTADIEDGLDEGRESNCDTGGSSNCGGGGCDTGGCVC